MIRQVGQVGFQVTQDIRTVARFEILPVLGVQAVGRGEFLFGFKDQTGKSAFGLDFDHSHLEVRCHLVEGVAAHESVVGFTGIGVTPLIEVKFSEVAVYTVLVASLPAV